MTFPVHLPPATVERLEARAAATGKEKEICTLVAEAVEKDVLHQKTTIAEAAEPIRNAIAASGMSPEEAEAQLAAELAGMQAEKKQKRNAPAVSHVRHGLRMRGLLAGGHEQARDRSGVSRLGRVW
jgi:hypothetical protein